MAEQDVFENKLFSYASNAYVFLTILGVFLTHFKKPSFTKQLYFHTITDIAFLLLVVYFNGGLNSGLGILLLLPVILPSVLQPGQASLFLSAITVISLLVIEAFYANTWQE